MGQNLHGIVRGAINAAHPDEEEQIMHSEGSAPDEQGFAQLQFSRIGEGTWRVLLSRKRDDPALPNHPQCSPLDKGRAQHEFIATKRRMGFTPRKHPSQ